MDLLDTADITEDQTTAQAAPAKPPSLWARFRAALRRKPLLRTALKAGIALAAVFAALSSMRGIHLGAIFGTMMTVSPIALALAVLTALLQSALLAARFWLIFPRKKRPSWGASARAFAYSQSANVYLPARAGEVLRVVTLTREAEREPHKSRPSVADAASATILDRVLDVFSFVVMALVFGKSLLFGAVVAALSWGWALLAGIAVLALVVLLVRRLAPRFFSKVRSAVREARSAARGLVSLPRFGAGITLGLLSWVAELGTMLLLSSGLGLQITALQMVISLIVLNLGIAIPVSFANIGAYEAATVIGLTPFGVSVTDAIALGTLHHGIQLLAVFGPALFFWVRDRLAARAAKRASSEPVLATATRRPFRPLPALAAFFRRALPVRSAPALPTKF